MSFEQNSNGLGVLQHYGARDTNKKFGGITGQKGDVVQVEYIFDYTDIDLRGNQDEVRHTFPAGAYFINGYMEALQAAAGSSPVVDIGLEAPDQGVQVTDAFVDGQDFTTLFSSTGDWINFSTVAGTNSGSFINQGTDQAYQLRVVLNSGSFSAGKFRTIIEYVEPRA